MTDAHGGQASTWQMHMGPPVELLSGQGAAANGDAPPRAGLPPHLSALEQRVEAALEQRAEAGSAHAGGSGGGDPDGAGAEPVSADANGEADARKDVMAILEKMQKTNFIFADDIANIKLAQVDDRNTLRDELERTKEKLRKTELEVQKLKHVLMQHGDLINVLIRHLNQASQQSRNQQLLQQHRQQEQQQQQQQQPPQQPMALEPPPAASAAAVAVERAPRAIMPRPASHGSDPEKRGNEPQGEQQQRQQQAGVTGKRPRTEDATGGGHDRDKSATLSRRQSWLNGSLQAAPAVPSSSVALDENTSHEDAQRILRLMQRQYRDQVLKKNKQQNSLGTQKQQQHNEQRPAPTTHNAAAVGPGPRRPSSAAAGGAPEDGKTPSTSGNSHEENKHENGGAPLEVAPPKADAQPAANRDNVSPVSRDSTGLKLLSTAAGAMPDSGRPGAATTMRAPQPGGKTGGKTLPGQRILPPAIAAAAKKTQRPPVSRTELFSSHKGGHRGGS